MRNVAHGEALHRAADSEADRVADAAVDVVIFYSDNASAALARAFAQSVDVDRLDAEQIDHREILQLIPCLQRFKPGDSSRHDAGAFAAAQHFRFAQFETLIGFV